MQVLHLRSAKFYGSPERLIVAQASRMPSGITADVAVVADSPVADFAAAAQKAGLRFFQVESGNPFSLKAIRLVRAMLKQEGYEILCTHDYKSNFVARCARIGLPVKQVSVFHGLTSHSILGRFYEFIDSIVLRTVDRVVAVSEATRDAIGSMWGRVVIVRNAFSDESFVSREEARRLWNFRPDQNVILTAGRLSVEKGHSRLIEAFCRIAQSDSSLHLVIAGDGPERKRLEWEASRSSVGNRIQFLGLVKDMATLYRAADLFILPSDREGLPLVILEAAAYGCPLISTKVGGVREFIEHDVSGILVECNSESLAASIERLIGDEKLRKELAEAARARLEESFSYERYAMDFAALFRDLYRPSSLWITWERHRRTRGIASQLRVPLVELTGTKLPWIRYPWALLRTVALLLWSRPAILIVQCPSLLLGSFAVFLKPLFRYTLVTDCHNEAVQPFIAKSSLAHRLVKWLHQKADLTIVTNESLASVVKQNGGRPIILPDPIPPIYPAFWKSKPGLKKAVLICTFAADEPYAEVIVAAGLLEDQLELAVTGNSQKADPKVYRAIPGNVRFTGFLDEQDYVNLLRHADVIVDLTEMEDCLLCGGYEAVAVERPLVTSDKKVLRGHFRRGTVYSSHTSTALAKAMREAVEKAEVLAKEMTVLKSELMAEWIIARNNLSREMFGVE